MIATDRQMNKWSTDALNCSCCQRGSLITQKRYKIELYLQWQTKRTLSNGAIFNDLEQPLTQFSHTQLYSLFEKAAQLYAKKVKT